MVATTETSESFRSTGFIFSYFSCDFQGCDLDSQSALSLKYTNGETGFMCIAISQLKKYQNLHTLSTQEARLQGSPDSVLTSSTFLPLGRRRAQLLLTAATHSNLILSSCLLAGGSEECMLGKTHTRSNLYSQV